MECLYTQNVEYRAVYTVLIGISENVALGVWRGDCGLFGVSGSMELVWKTDFRLNTPNELTYLCPQVQGWEMGNLEDRSLALELC